MLAVPSLMKWGLSAAAGPAASTIAASAVAGGPRSTSRSRRIGSSLFLSPGLGDDFDFGVERAVASPPFTGGRKARPGGLAWPETTALAARPANSGQQTRGEGARGRRRDAGGCVDDAYAGVTHLRQLGALLALRATVSDPSAFTVALGTKCGLTASAAGAAMTNPASNHRQREDEQDASSHA